MFRNFFTTAYRNFRRNKVFTLINVVGLSIGISASLVIYLIVHYDFSFDKFHKNGDRIYRVVTDMKFAGDPFKNSGVPFPMPEAVRHDLSGIESSTMFYEFDQPKVSTAALGDKQPLVFKKASDVAFADDHYFSFFPFYKWLAGNPTNALKDIYKVVLTESRAKQYFPGLDLAQIVGRQVTYNDSVVTTVSGIVKDPTETTDLRFKEFISYPTVSNTGLKNMISDDWGNITSSFQFLVELQKGTTPAQVEKKLVDLRKKYTPKEEQTSSNATVHRLQPLSDIHFNNDYDNFDGRIAHKPTLYGLMLVAIFLLLLGCINFINLTTAQATQRAKEIGIRKTVGSSRRQLIIQFLSETFLLTLVSTILSLALTPWLLKIFSDFIPPGLHFNIIQQPGLILFLVALIMVVSFCSGFYPALVLSGFRPVLVLKNQVYSNTGKTRRAWLRKSLTVSQFVIAEVFIMATLIVGKQIHYSLNKDLGFKKDAIVTFWTPWNFYKPDTKRFVLEDKLHSIPGIEMISLGSESPASSSTNTSTMRYKDGKKDIQTDVQTKNGDTNYLKLYHLKLLAGRNVMQSDTPKELVINETYARILGFNDPNKAIGAMIGDEKKLPVVGVMADFHQKSLHTPIKPLAFRSALKSSYVFHIALAQSNAGAVEWKNTISKIESAYKEIYPDDDFNYKFFDESIAEFYKSEQNISRLLQWATGLAILISCLGMLGLVMYTTNLRTKEIGVRKVLGASVANIVTILSKDFVRLVIIAFIIASPVAWWSMTKWLQNFAYRTELSWWLFAASGMLIIIIALLTLSFQTIRAARANPVKSLRTE